MSNLVTPAEVEKFRRDGYWICHAQFFPATKLRKLQETFEEILSRKHVDKRPEDIDVPHFAYPELFEWLLADEVLDRRSPSLLFISLRAAFCYAPAHAPLEPLRCAGLGARRCGLCHLSPRAARSRKNRRRL